MSNTTDPHYPDTKDFDGAEIADIIITVFALVFSVCVIGVVIALTHKPASVPAEEVLEHEQAQERRREWISQHLAAKEWIPKTRIEEDASATSSDVSAASSADADDEELAIQAVPFDAPVHLSVINERQTAKMCPMGCDDDTDDAVSLSDDRPGCAICLGAFEDRQLVCESSNTSCEHTFHEVCMSSWLLKHDDCPMCRQTYLLKTV